MWDPEESQQRVPLLRGQGDFGKPLEPDASYSGIKPSSQRKCQDVLFAIAFGLMFAAMVAIAATGFAQGNPELLVPSNIPDQSEIENYAVNKAEVWFQDAVYLLKEDTPVLAGALAGAIVLAAIWVQLLRMFTKIFIWLTLILGVLFILALGVYLAAVGHGNVDPPHLVGYAGSIAGSEGVMIVGFVLIGVAVVLAIVCVALRNKIDLTAAMIEEACKGIQHNPSVFIVTLIVMALFAAFCVAWVAQFIYLYSIPAEDVDAVPNGIPVKFNTKVRNLMYFQVFGFLWTSAFLSGVFQVSIAGAVSSWYFSRSNAHQESDVGSPALVTLMRAFTLSFGSIAFGSLILAVVEFINFLLQQAKKASGKNKLVVFLISCIQCCLGCLTSLVKFIDRFAYIYIAMHGESFCSSAKGVFNLISRNAIGAVLVDFLGGFVLFVGRLLGTAAMTLFTMLIVNGLTGRHVSYITLAIVAVVSFAVFTLFSRIISMASCAVFVCYMEDTEMNPDALHLSPELHQKIQAKAREVNEKDRSCC